MPVIVVANPKGGVGKSTVATNVAGYLARQGRSVMLGDVDRQESARTWLSLRPASLPAIQSWEVSHDSVVRPPKGTTHVVLDTPAGLHGKRLEQVMKFADKVLLPIQASIFDIYATREFLVELLDKRRGSSVQVGILGNRVRDNTIAAEHLREFLGTLDIPVVGYLRDTQNYVHLAARGLTLWDVAPGRVERDLEQWQPIAEWVSR